MDEALQIWDWEIFKNWGLVVGHPELHNAKVDTVGITPHGMPPGYLEVKKLIDGSWAELAGVNLATACGRQEAG